MTITAMMTSTRPLQSLAIGFDELKDLSNLHFATLLLASEAKLPGTAS